MKIYIAFYKYKRPLNSWQNVYFRFFDEIIKLCTRGKYSHCEIAIKEENDTKYMCYSSSNRDGGVRKKYMELQPERWDLIELDQKQIKVSDIKNFFKRTEGLKYDFLGACGVVLGFGNAKSKYFCSEWCAEALKLSRPHKYSPVSLFNYIFNSTLFKYRN